MTRRPWSSRDDARLRWIYGTRSLASVAADLGRTEEAIRKRARALGLRPDGEPVYLAARRCGFSHGGLLAVLRWARSRGVRVPVVCAGRVARVDPEDADAAVALWLRSETVAEAARRLGVDPVALRRRLAAAALEPPRRRAVWRVLPSEVDAAMAGRVAA